MLDFTYDPLVALYFASFEPREGQIGLVQRLSPAADFANFEMLSSIGKLMLICLPSVNRLRNQRALLLEGATSDVVDQLVPFRLRFRQHAKVSFIDANIGISDEKLLDSDEALTNFASNFETTPDSVPCNLGNHGFTNRVILVKNLNGYLAKRGRAMEESKLEMLVDFHLAMERDPSLAAYTYSVRNLIQLVEDVVNGAESIKVIQDNYLHTGNSAVEKKAILQCMRSTVFRDGTGR